MPARPPGRDRSARRAGRGALGALLAAGAVVAAPPSALAHTALESSDPAAGSQVRSLPSEVRLVFTQPVDPRVALVALSAVDGAPQELSVSVTGATVVAAVPAGTADASADPAWRVDYRVLSADGHPVSGSVPFTVAAASRVAASLPSPTTTPAPPPAADPGVRTGGGSGAASLLPWAAGAVVLAAVVAWVLRRRAATDG